MSNLNTYSFLKYRTYQFNREGWQKLFELFPGVVLFHLSGHNHSAQLLQLLFFRKLQAFSHHVPNFHSTVINGCFEWCFVIIGSQRNLGVTSKENFRIKFISNLKHTFGSSHLELQSTKKKKLTHALEESAHGLLDPWSQQNGADFHRHWHLSGPPVDCQSCLLSASFKYHMC